MKYAESIYKTKRWKTREVKVGKVGVGGGNPIRIQSMTTSNTRDAAATVEQIIRLADEGCEIARVTVQGMKEADACEAIKSSLISKGYTIPLVADIHFYPPAAMRVADFADKVRINPGNFVDKRASFKKIEYNDETYADEIKKIEEKFSPLVEKCKKLKKAIRIGTNHGSLSDRIMNKYGDTPQGMVESALEFTRICRQLDYHDIIFSMKASNTKVMIQAYRLLVAEMMRLGWDYPLHLGVTEAGEGEDGRVKSAIGIGSLLLDGIGDTIRVSLTEDPWCEIDPCKRLIALAKEWEGRGIEPFEEKYRSIATVEKRDVEIKPPLHADGTVFVRVKKEEASSPTLYADLGCQTQFGKPFKDIATVDAIFTDHSNPILEKVIPRLCNPLIMTENYKEWPQLLDVHPNFVLFAPTQDILHNGRKFFDWLQERNLKIPVVLCPTYYCSEEDLVIKASAECGALLSDGLGEGLLIDAPVSLKTRRSLAFSILQGCRMRQSKTEFISCPGCGRTLFDLQTVAASIREKTGHLPGVKIAVMGCIVNGPGEMADADFGYVGSKPGKIDLYIGKQCVLRDIEMEDACEKLIHLIKENGRWVEPNEITI